jgi:ABC-type transport system involved in cytochrome bd biosynthesis fused ATPase/permease subunit
VGIIAKGHVNCNRNALSCNYLITGCDLNDSKCPLVNLTFYFQVTGSLNWMVRMSSDLETNIVSVERVKEYAEIDTEAEWYSENNPPPGDWPQHGKVDFDNFSVRYRPGLDLVLRGVTFNIKGGERVSTRTAISCTCIVVVTCTSP